MRHDVADPGSPGGPQTRAEFVILNQYYVPDVASTGHLLAELAHESARLGRSVSVITSFPSYGPPETWQPCEAFEQRDGVTVRRMRTTRFRKDSLLGRVSNSVTFLVPLALRMLFSRSRGRVFMYTSNPPFLGIIGGIVSLVRPHPYVVLLHDSYPHLAVWVGKFRSGSLVERAWHLVNRLLYGRARQTIVLCERAKALVVREYGIVPVRDAVWLNRVLRDAGYLKVRSEGGREHLDLESSRAFAVADHQIAHVSVRDPADIAAVEEILAKVDGVERTLSGDARRTAGLDHPRAGEIVCVSAVERWFAYGWWFNDSDAPDYARTVDIHRKPGYDPCELFHDPKRLWPKGHAIGKLLLRKLGLRALLDVVPLDASLVRGSHGRVDVPRGFDPILIGELPDPFLEQELPMACVRDAILASTLGDTHGRELEAHLGESTRTLLHRGRR